MKQTFIIGATSAIILAILYFALSSGAKEQASSFTEENGQQVVRVLARAGYSPKVIQAQAGKPTKLEIETKGTYDCSSALAIPSMQYQTQLPANGTTTIDIPPQKAGDIVKGVCAMGMYSFAIHFK